MSKTTTTSNNIKKTSVRLCVLGDGGVGKTAITIQFISNHFVEYYDPTIEDSYRRQCLIDNEIYMLDILDTAGQDEFSAMRDQWIRECDGFLLIYSMDLRSSFDQIQIFKEQINRVLDKNDVPIMLVANKCDLPENERQVSYQEGKDLARCLGMSSFLEVSAKNRTNIEESFYETVRCVIRNHQVENNKKVLNNNSKNNSIFKKINNKVNSTKSSICKMM